MNLKIKFLMWQAKRAAGPAGSFKRKLANQLSMAWDAQNGPVTSSLLVWRYAAVGVLSIVAASTTGLSVYAYSSPQVAAGTALFPVKLAIEKVEELTKKTPQAKAEFYVKQLERREAEKAVLKEKQVKPLPVVETTIKNLESAIEETEPMISTDTLIRQKPLANKLREHFEKQKNRLEQENRDPATEPKSDDKNDRLEKIQQITNRLEEVKKEARKFDNEARDRLEKEGQRDSFKDNNKSSEGRKDSDDDKNGKNEANMAEKPSRGDRRGQE